MEKVKIVSDDGYLHLPDLPENSLFNKVVTGCGGTSIALFNQCDYVIAVPTVELIISKTGMDFAGLSDINDPCDRHAQSVFSLFGTLPSSTMSSFARYVKTDGVHKIMCTYDRVPLVSSLIDVSKYKILVDEYHGLLKDYGYRDRAVKGVFDNFRSYRSFCFMSATPLSADFVPSILSGIRTVEAEWEKLDTVKVDLVESADPCAQAARIILQCRKNGYYEHNGMKSAELFFFVNSVTEIAKILYFCKLDDGEVKIVCADTADNRNKLKDYSISNCNSANRPFTFITRKAFEGVDYFSATGLCFVVSNTQSSSTLLDISTDIFQIAGRIRTRENPFRNCIIHIFNKDNPWNLNRCKTWEEVLGEAEEENETNRQIIDFMNNSNRKSLDQWKMIRPEYVLQDADGKFWLNDILTKLRLFTYRIFQEVYGNGLKTIASEYLRSGMAVSGIGKVERQGKLPKLKARPFKAVFLEYAGLMRESDNLSGNLLKLSTLESEQPLIRRAYAELGEEEVKRLKYNKANIDRALSGDDKVKQDYLERLITAKIAPGFYPNAKLKSMLQQYYGIAGINKTAKASDIAKWFDCKPVSRRNGKTVVNGHELYRCLVIDK